ncbi:hypothetical protein PS15m_000891 [Mucor circinelloides]
MVFYQDYLTTRVSHFCFIIFKDAAIQVHHQLERMVSLKNTINCITHLKLQKLQQRLQKQ